MCGLISGIYILFHWSMPLFLNQLQAALIMTAVYYVLKCAVVMASAIFLLHKIALAFWGLHFSI